MSKAELLWLYYDYVTEMFDRNLPHELSKHGDGVAIVSPMYVNVSNRNAKMVWDYIYAVAEYWGTSSEEMSHERRYRLRYSMDGRIREYEYISSKLAFKLDFIEDYNEYRDLMNVEIRQRDKHVFELNDELFITINKDVER